MQRIWGIALFFVVLAISILNGQQSAPATPPQAADATSDRVKVYSPGPDVTAPELLPIEMPLSNGKCKEEPEGKVTLATVIDAGGQPHNVTYLQPVGNDLDKLAILVVKADRFKPGIRDGKPVAVGQSVEVSIKGCVVETKDETGKKDLRLVLRSQPEQKLGPLPEPLDVNLLTLEEADGKKINPHLNRIGGSISPPVPLNLLVDAEFSEEARRIKFQGICLLSLMVDQQGKPQNIRIIRPLGHGLDQKATEAASKYRFKPAMKDGKPVPVMITVEVDFRF